MEAYFDNSATTRVFDSVKDIVVKAMTEDYGNPSAKHRKGMEAEQYVRQAAARVAKTLKVKEKEILFTSGGTESNNMALIDPVYCRPDGHHGPGKRLHGPGQLYLHGAGGAGRGL